MSEQCVNNHGKLCALAPQMMSAGLVTAISARILIEQCETLGIDSKVLLNQVGISYESIRNPSAYVSVENMTLLWNSALRLTRDEMFGLHAAEKVPFGTYRVLDHMFTLSSSPKDGLIRSSRTFGLANSAFTLSVRVHQDFIYLEIQTLSQKPGITRAHIEYILCNYLTRLRMVTQIYCSPSEVHLTFDPPSSLAEYDRVFRAPVRFRQAVNRMVFSRKLMEMRLPLADPELCEVLEDYAQRRLRNTIPKSSILFEIQNAMAENLVSGNSKLSLLARQFAKSSRSLQREIRANGMTYRELLDMTRRDRALALLTQKDLPVKEVAIRLNFGDSSSFCRAFRRWTGKSPAEFRMRSIN